MRIRITLDHDIYEIVMGLSKASGERPGKILSRLARRALRPSSRKKTPGRFPMFKVPPDAPLILASRIQRFLDRGF